MAIDAAGGLPRGEAGHLAVQTRFVFAHGFRVATGAIDLGGPGLVGEPAHGRMAFITRNLRVDGVGQDGILSRGMASGAFDRRSFASDLGMELYLLQFVRLVVAIAADSLWILVRWGSGQGMAILATDVLMNG